MYRLTFDIDSFILPLGNSDISKQEKILSTKIYPHSSYLLLLKTYILSIISLYTEMVPLLILAVLITFMRILYPCCLCSVTQLSLTVCDLMDCYMPGLSDRHYLLKFAQLHVHCIGDAIHSSYPLISSIIPSIRDFSKESAVCIR